MRLKTTTALASLLLMMPNAVYAAKLSLFPDLQTAKKAYKAKDYTTAAQNWMPLAHKGNPEAQVELGKLYSKGLGVKQNSTTAMNLFMSSAKQGDARAMFEIGRAYERGDGIPKNIQKSKEWYQLAADSGYARGNYQIGALYQKNKLNQTTNIAPSTKDSIKNAVNEMKDGNYAQAEYLGNLYQQGIHVPANYKTALTYFKVAQANGSQSAAQKIDLLETKVSLSQLYKAEHDAKLILAGRSKIVREERKDVIRELKSLRAADPTQAQILERDKKALKYYERAADSGYARAEKKVAEINNIDPASIEAIPKAPKKKYRIVSSVRAQITGQENIDLGTRSEDLETALILDGLAGVYLHPTENITTYVEARGVHSDGVATSDNDDDDDTTDASFLELRQAWVNFDNLFGVDPLALKIGRQRFYEPRGLWWNRDFDAVRLAMDTTLTKGFVAVGENQDKYRIGDNDDLERDEEDRLRVLGEISHNYTQNHFIEARVLFEDDHSGTEAIGATIPSNDRDNEDNNLTWVGLRAKGNAPIPNSPISRMGYRGDILGVSGSEDTVTTTAGSTSDLRTVSAVNNRDVLGWAVDGSVDFLLDTALEPTVTLGYAYGSGDDGKGDNNAFRQSDLHGNTSRFPEERTANSLRNYGEVLRPELSNIHVATLGVNVPLLKASDINVNYFSYWLDDPATNLRSSGITAPLNNTDAHLGQALDFTANISLGKEMQTTSPLLRNTSIRFKAGGFKGGEAYGAAEDEYAYRGSTELRIKF